MPVQPLSCDTDTRGPSMTMRRAKAMMKAASIACLNCDPKAAELATAALEALREAQAAESAGHE